MRATARRTRATMRVSLRDFGWERAEIAALRHSTLPWLEGVRPEVELAATPLAEAGELGTRDRLSLLAQFAAHVAFLQFAGIGDSDFDPADWAVIRKRETDCRLVRVAVHGRREDAPPSLTLAQHFADAVRSPKLDVLRQSWARAESIYAECHSHLRAGGAADLRWLAGSAAGEVLGPGPDALRALWSDRDARLGYSDPRAIDALRAMADLDPTVSLVVVRGGSILRYGAIDALSAEIGPIDSLAETEIAEHVVAAMASKHLVFAVADAASLDEPSRRVVQILSSMQGAGWIVPSASSGTETRYFIVSPRLAARRALESRLGSTADAPEWIERFVSSPRFATYLDDGALPPDDEPAIDVPEPNRSYLAALALVGRSFPRELASRFLREFLFDRGLDELHIEGITHVSDTQFEFVSDAVCEHVASLNPPASRPAICRVAARFVEQTEDLGRAAALLVEAGESQHAAQILERVEWSSAEQIVAALQKLPRSVLAGSRKLAGTLADALLGSGRYRDAGEVALLLPDPDRELVLAGVERRMGDYGPALARLERLPRSGSTDLLRADILIVERCYDEARNIIATAVPESEDDRVRLGYLRDLLNDGETGERWLDSPSPLRRYFAARLGTYGALDRGDFDEALAQADESAAAAATIPQRIDSHLDRVYALFAAGRWNEARAAAIEALAVVEETQGDRAAGGLLFVLAYLCADDGQWAHASQRIDRLRHFYSQTNDERRLIELDLLAAHLDFSQGRFDSARRIAASLLDRSCDAPIREAASLIVDEVDWIEQRAAAQPPPGEVPSNLEFRDRYLLNASRRGASIDSVRGAFNKALAEWERKGKGDAPEAHSGSDRLKILRSALARGRWQNDSALLAIAHQIAHELRLEIEPPKAAAPATTSDFAILRAAARREFPFASGDFGGVVWRFATRNRLGHWHQIGSASSLAADDLDRLIVAPCAGWIPCSDRELLYIEGSESWSAESREAVAAQFRTRAELHRLRRVVEQEEGAGEVSRTAVEFGIVGDSTPIRDVIALIVRVARRDVTVCIRGESGTGKELVARALHRNSTRRQKTFTAVNCAALPEHLIESELFGHVRGAFTGADRDRAGLIESSDGGTLFLDEIGEMPLPAQAKLLRFMQEGEFRRVGDTVNRSADVRMVTATNRKLETAVEEGRFREDLYYRVRVVEIALPPLRERGSDIPLLASSFLAAEREKHRFGPSRLSPEVEAIFASYGWPGNVRELQNTIRAAHAVAGEAKEIDIEHLPERLRNVVPSRVKAGSYQEAVSRFRRDLIEKSLAQANGNQNQAAAVLKISRQALAYQIKELGILTGKSRH